MDFFLKQQRVDIAVYIHLQVEYLRPVSKKTQEGSIQHQTNLVTV